MPVCPSSMGEDLCPSVGTGSSVIVENAERKRLAAKLCPHMPAVSSLSRVYTQFSRRMHPTQCRQHIKRLPWDH